jgi:hypothetical protein
LNTIIIAQIVISIVFSMLHMQLTGKAFTALLEGPFAGTILELEGDIFAKEYLLDATGAAAEDHLHSLESLGKLRDRMEENRRSCPWKTLFSKSDILVRDFV